MKRCEKLGDGAVDSLLASIGRMEYALEISGADQTLLFGCNISLLLYTVGGPLSEAGGLAKGAFSASWTDSQINSEVKLVGGKPVATRASDWACLYQFTVNGAKVEIVEVGGNVMTGCPCAGYATAEDFIGK